MNVGLMRSEITKVYPGKDWKTRVKNMPDTQVIAIYNSFLRNDRFKIKHKEQIVEHSQLTFDDILSTSLNQAVCTKD